MAMYIAKKNDTGKRWATITIYRECQRNHSAQSGRDHVVDGCPEFLGHGEERSELAFYCSKCGCNRNFHRKEEISVLADPTTVQTVHELAAPRPHHAAGAPPRPLPPVPVVFLRNGEAQQEPARAPKSWGGQQACPPLPKRGRTQFTKAQQAAMRAYAEILGWGLRGENQLQISEFCSGTGITLQNFKLWMRNNKKKYNVEPEESAASCVGL